MKKYIKKHGKTFRTSFIFSLVREWRLTFKNLHLFSDKNKTLLKFQEEFFL